VRCTGAGGSPDCLWAIVMGSLYLLILHGRACLSAATAGATPPSLPLMGTLHSLLQARGRAR